MELTQKITWHKLSAREVTEEDKELYGEQYDSMWDGQLPELDEEVIVYVPDEKTIYKDLLVFTDIWVDYPNGVGFEQTDVEIGETVYWTSFPKPPKLD